MTSPVQPVPCEPWCDAEDIRACGCDLGDQIDLEVAAAAATEILFELSGHRFTGICEQTVRPCGEMSCWHRLPYFRTDFYPHHWYARSCCCSRLSRVRLAGYPVQSIEEVLIDGEVVPPDEYRLERDRELVRIADSQGQATTWPSCQRMDLDSGPGTFFVSYRFGTPPPITGVSAAAQLACEIGRGCLGPEECSLPRGTVRVSRLGIAVDTQALGLWLIGSIRTGMPLVDAFMSVYGTPRRQARVALYVPEQDPWPVRVQQ